MSAIGTVMYWWRFLFFITEMNTSQRLSLAGKELLKGNFGNAIKSLTISPATFHKDDVTGEFFYPLLGNSSLHFRWTGHNSSLTAYQKCPPVPAIINRKAQAYINGKTWVLNTQGRAKEKEATSVEAKKLQNLLKRPNPLQSWKQFEAQAYIYQQLFGWTIILPIRPFGFKDNIDATSLWNIPPFMVDIEETNRLFYQSDTKGIIKKIVLSYKGQRTELEVENVFIMKDFTPSFDSLILPNSRICALEMPINNIIGAYESRNVLINYRGALGILSQETGGGQYPVLPVTDDKKKELQKEFQRYGLKNSQWQFIITSAALKWQSMSIPTKDLMLFEEIEDDIMRICDQYGYPYQLMSSAKGTTFSNVKEAKQLLYQDSIIPEAENIYEQWNQFFQLDKYNLRMDKDFAHLPVLQEDEVQKMTARRTRDEAYQIEWENDLITRNQWRTANGEDPLPGDDLLRSQQITESNQPLAVSIGVGGVQGLIAVITAQGMSDEARRATLEVVFGLTPADAARMAQSNSDNQNNDNGNDQEQSG